MSIYWHISLCVYSPCTNILVFLILSVNVCTAVLIAAEKVEKSGLYSTKVPKIMQALLWITHWKDLCKHVTSYFKGRNLQFFIIISINLITILACVLVHTPWGKCPIENYSQRSLALLIPGSRLNARNSPGAHPYCNRQSLKKCADWTKLRKFSNMKIFLNFNVKISRSTVCCSTSINGIDRLPNNIHKSL